MNYGHFIILSSLPDEERTREYKKLMQGICFQENDVTKSHRHGIPGNYMTTPQDVMGPADGIKEPSPNLPPLTFGQRLVGLNFNPSNDDKVGRAKQLFAQIADLLKEEHTTKESSNGEAAELNALLYTHAIGEILNAQMCVVKVLTLKY